MDAWKAHQEVRERQPRAEADDLGLGCAEDKAIDGMTILDQLAHYYMSIPPLVQNASITQTPVRWRAYSMLDTC